ncbi:MAG: HD domain-containing protein [Planctomycetaceae bacterium]|nr:HD domain-containing protein [Planctomycetaceae bacterium]
MIVPLHELEPNQEADLFALLAEKELTRTKEGKPYFWVTFRDAHRAVRFPVWSDTALYREIKSLKPGTCCKLRAIYRITSFGPQLEVHKIRITEDADAQDGFNPMLLRPASPISAEKMFEELHELAKLHLDKSKLYPLVLHILKEHREVLLFRVASRQHHHNYISGLLEHTLSVTKIAIALVEHYHKMYPDKAKDISRPLVVSGAMLHDIGKVREYESDIGSLAHSAVGELIGHAILGRDIVREAALGLELESAEQTHLEHIIVSHQRFADWGAAKPPMSLEAMIVHHADSCDALLGCFWNTFSQDATEQELTSKKNVIGYPLLKPQDV